MFTPLSRRINSSNEKFLHSIPLWLRSCVNWLSHHQWLKIDSQCSKNCETNGINSFFFCYMQNSLQYMSTRMLMIDIRLEKISNERGTMHNNITLE